MEISVDNHTLSVIATDGSNLQPTMGKIVHLKSPFKVKIFLFLTADSLVSYAGERFDFVLNANQSIGRYWLRVRGLMDCDDRFKSVHQVAIISYKGADQEPKEPVGYKEAVRKGKVIYFKHISQAEFKILIFSN